MSDIDTQPESDEIDPSNRTAAEPAPEATPRRPRKPSRPPSETSTFADDPAEESVSPIFAFVGGLAILTGLADLAILLMPRRAPRPRYSLFSDLRYSPSHWLHAASDAERDLMTEARRYAARLQANIRR